MENNGKSPVLLLCIVTALLIAADIFVYVSKGTLRWYDLLITAVLIGTSVIALVKNKKKKD